MIGEKKIKKMIQTILSASPAEQTEVVCIARKSGLTRFANSTIHQNVAEENVLFQIRCAVGKKVSKLFINGTESARLKEAVRDCYEMARTQKEDPEFPGFPGPVDVPYPHVNGYDEKTDLVTPMDRARAVLDLIKITEKEGVTVFGALSSQTLEVGIENSLGIS
ncbi:MAG: hypothetical protein J7M18_06680, partial [Candidatus Eremiobacteraeota bacterium]|nr:hypothetical protein [Candidatus Eremiobacteraeota bacterium]